MSLIESLNWRYATKRMNGNKLPQDKLDTILEAVRLSASSLGMQPYRVVVIDEPELKAKIHALACKQPQVLESSHLLVFASWKEISNEQVNEYIGRVAVERNVPIESLKQFSDMINGGLASKTALQKAEWAARQAYIGLGFGLVAAAQEEVDTTPMEGFNAEALNEILGLKESNLNSVVLLALGYRDEKNDHLVKAKKVRLSKNEFFISNN